jgi:hypothetical protein
MNHSMSTFLAVLAGLSLWCLPSIQAADPALSGELKQWHPITLTLDGPWAKETDRDPNPFLDYRMVVTFAHESGSPCYRVPGYFAADGHAAHTSADSGNRWRAHVSPAQAGRWTYTVSFVKGKQAAIEPTAGGQPVAGIDGQSGSFMVRPTDKSGRDFRAKGRLEYAGRHYLRFAGTGEYFLKAGADAPENFLAFFEFDGTGSRKKADAAARPGEAMPAGLHRYEPHAKDWRPGDPTWRDGKGKNIIGALNYLAGKGCNAFSFLTYNVGGDGDDVWPFVAPEDKLHYDCSKLDQWQMVFDHAQRLGLYLHFKMQETENDDQRLGKETNNIPAALDGGDLGVERRLYCRELIARFGCELALNWNIGEENSQSPEQQRAIAQYLRETDPYPHHIVIHTFPDWQDRVYSQLLGSQSALTGASLQNHWSVVHQRTLKWLTESDRAGRPWVVANDEQNPAGLGVPPSPGYQGFDGKAKEKASDVPYDLHDIRKLTLWGNLMAGGAGVEYYFGYRLPENDLKCEDWRSRDQSWDYCRIALSFFKENAVPFWEMANADALVGNPQNDNRRYCLAKTNVIYVVYLPQGGTSELDLGASAGKFKVRWFNPRLGGKLQTGSVKTIQGPGNNALGQPPSDPDQDWTVLIRR